MANTGYLGIPLAGVLLGRGAVAPAIAFDLLVSQPFLFIGAFGVAAATGSEGGGTADRLRTRINGVKSYTDFPSLTRWVSKARL